MSKDVLLVDGWSGDSGCCTGSGGKLSSSHDHLISCCRVILHFLCGILTSHPLDMNHMICPHLGHPSPAKLVNLEHSVVLEGGEVDVALEDFNLERLPLLGVQLTDLLPQPRAVEQHGAYRPQLQV